MKIDILIGDNTYGTVVHFSQSLKNALTRLGVETRTFWVGEGHFFHAFYEIMDNPPDLTCSFSDISLEGKPLSDLWQISHLSLLLDPPIYSLHQFQSKSGFVSCVDEFDCAFVRALGFSNVFFLPHGGESAYLTVVGQARPYDVVFFGTCIDYEAVAAAWPPAEKELLFAASDRVLSNQEISIVQALVQLGVKEGDLPRLHTEVDRYICGKERIELIRSIKNHKVHIWGSGPWEKFCPNHIVNPALPFDQVLEVMKKSKVTLNSSPRFKSGAHERIFYASLCGSSVYTAENPYLKTHLPLLHTYRYGNLHSPSFANWQAHAEANQAQVLASHTWDARAATLLEKINVIFC